MSVVENLVIAAIGGMVAWMGISLFRYRRRMARWEVAEVLARGSRWWWGQPSGLHLGFLTALLLPFTAIAWWVAVEALLRVAISAKVVMWTRLVVITGSVVWIGALLAISVGLFNTWNAFLLSKEANRGEKALCSMREWHLVFLALVGATSGAAMVAYGLSAIVAR